MDELEKIRQKKLEELKKQHSQAQQPPAEDQALQQQIQQLEAAIKPHFTREALERYGNIKAADREKAVQVVVVLSQLLQRGQISQVDDALFKKILNELTPAKKDFKIRRV